MVAGAFWRSDGAVSEDAVTTLDFLRCTATALVADTVVSLLRCGVLILHVSFIEYVYGDVSGITTLQN